MNKEWSLGNVVVVIAAVFSLAMCAEAANTYSVVRNFSPRSGDIPYGGLLMDQAGNLYGADSSGGTQNWGAIFELTPNGKGGWTYTEIYDCGKADDCSVPVGSLVMDEAGDLYGVTYFGNVFELMPSGSGVWTGRVIHTFGGGSDGSAPSPVILDGDGDLYGVNGTGGHNNLGYVFELTSSIGGWSLVHLHDFTGSDGAETTNTAGGQVAGLVWDSAGNLYGTTGLGGSSAKCQGGCGLIFELKNDSGSWTETVLHDFTGSDGANPDAPLTMDAAGNLYGTTTSGGTKGLGVVFKLAPSSGTWSSKVLHDFTGAHLDGAYPNTALIVDAGGNLYGATESGGADLQSCQVMNDFGCGTAFELSPNGTQWKISILHAFTGRKDGGFPGGVVRDSSGNLYGAAQAGGANAGGLLFKIVP
ncbi:MAG: choice-of-anchor tandem repeat GloVer-containing protein [Candidatus Sulfotelmatobacter sp.]